MAKRIELWPINRLVPYTKNPRTHSDAQVAQIAASIVEFGFNAPILVDSKAGIVAGHGRLLAARKLGLAEVPVIVLDHLTEIQKRAYLIADNKLTLLGGWDEGLLAQEFSALESEGFDLGLTGFSEQELEGLLREDGAEATEPDEEIPEAPAVAVTQPGDLWLIGPHRLLCGDCRDAGAVALLFEGRKANVVVTSPPYATQREYDPASGFRPVAPEEYTDWYRTVAENIALVLAADGSYFLNIKEHAEEGQRHLYVKDLTIAHVRQWGWRFVDEFCWRKTDNGVPGGWGNRFKNAWEPVFHFCRQPQIKFRPEAVSHESDGVFDYSPDTPRSNSGSGLLGQHPHREGLARPSNVIEAKTEATQGSHSAPFPRAIPEFFIKAFSDPCDAVFDPFLGSGTTMVAAALLDRIGYGIEISPAYCDVVLRRMQNTVPDLVTTLAGTNQTFEEVAQARGVDLASAASRHTLDVKSIRHKNGMPYYGTRKRAPQALPFA
jgi:DNA modification methylase